MAVCIETLIPNGERRNPVIGRDLFSTCIYFGSVSFFFFFFKISLLPFLRENEEKFSFEKKEKLRQNLKSRQK